jgi:hypothetical protein
MLHGTDWSVLGWPFLGILCCDSVTGGGRQKPQKSERSEKERETFHHRRWLCCRVGNDQNAELV